MRLRSVHAIDPERPPESHDTIHMTSARAATPEEAAELVVGTPTDDPWWFTYGDTVLTPADLIEILAPRLTANRVERLERVLAERTDQLAVVIEGMVDLGNVGAVMRSADGFGMQQFHTIDTAGAYKRSRRTSQGTDKWLDRRRWESAATCLGHLSAAGYRILAADPDPAGEPIDRCDLTGRTALVFGNELAGITDEVRSLSDGLVRIPMVGFAESFNISVAAAIALYEAHRQRTERWGTNGDMDPGRLDQVRAVWYAKSVRESRKVIERALDDGHRAAGT